MNTSKAVAEIKREQLSKNLQKSHSNTLVKKADCYELSAYNGSLSAKNVIENIAKIKIAFSGLPVEFYNLFSKRIKEKNFSDQQLTDAVNHVIDTCIYPSPTIAQFLNFDKKIELFSYSQMLKMNDQNRGIMKQFVSVNIDGKMMYARKFDFEEYSLKKWEVQNIT